MFTAIGITLAAYTVYCIRSGRVSAKSGAWGRTVTRQDSPGYFWAVVATYAVLSVALVTVF